MSKVTVSTPVKSYDFTGMRPGTHLGGNKFVGVCPRCGRNAMVTFMAAGLLWYVHVATRNELPEGGTVLIGSDGCVINNERGIAPSPHYAPDPDADMARDWAEDAAEIDREMAERQGEGTGGGEGDSNRGLSLDPDDDPEPVRNPSSPWRERQRNRGKPHHLRRTR